MTPWMLGQQKHIAHHGTWPATIRVYPLEPGVLLVMFQERLRDRFTFGPWSVVHMGWARMGLFNLSWLVQLPHQPPGEEQFFSRLHGAQLQPVRLGRTETERHVTWSRARAPRELLHHGAGSHEVMMREIRNQEGEDTIGLLVVPGPFFAQPGVSAATCARHVGRGCP